MCQEDREQTRWVVVRTHQQRISCPFLSLVKHSNLFIFTFIYPYIHTYLKTCIRLYLVTFLQTHILTCMHSFPQVIRVNNLTTVMTRIASPGPLSPPAPPPRASLSAKSAPVAPPRSTHAPSLPSLPASASGVASSVSNSSSLTSTVTPSSATAVAVASPSSALMDARRKGPLRQVYGYLYICLYANGYITGGRGREIGIDDDGRNKLFFALPILWIARFHCRFSLFLSLSLSLSLSLYIYICMSSSFCRLMHAFLLRALRSNP